ncbi:MAG: shikimate kinase [Coprococcus sp.]|nr:shikimate kinase [Coprococcus sp.]
MVMKNYNIFLIGFMGAGKSSVSGCLSREYGMDAVEMDEVIAKREGMGIPEIFEKRGEEYFRRLETELLIEIQSRNNAVVSCGGGAAMREQNVAEMKKNGKVVLLTACPETILNRVKDSDERPLLNGHKDVKYISGLMEARRERYEAAADIVVDTEGKSVSQICGELLEKLQEMDDRKEL